MAESEMVLKVAKAILYDFMPHKDAWEIVDEDSRKRCIGYARAAIEAMLEPTEAMRDAGNAIGHEEAPATYYTAMVVAALRG